MLELEMHGKTKHNLHIRDWSAFSY